MRVYLAATSELYRHTATKRRGINCKVKRLLTSFTNSNWTSTDIEAALINAQPEDYCVDSGAHVWLSSFFKSNERAEPRLVEKHLTNFMAAIEGMKKPPTFVVELDLQRIYGPDMIAAWRRDLWVPFEKRTGIRVCYVWHPGEEWKPYLDHPDMHYLGMGGANSDFDVPSRAQMVYAAYKAAKPVHGFASVNAKWIRAVPFYSVDSTSWAAGTFFGTVPVFDAKTGKVRQLAAGRSSFSSSPKAAAGRLAKAGGKVRLNALTERDGTKQDYSAFYQHASEVYVRFEQWFTAYWRARGVDWDARLAEVRSTG